jgi:hypothetical protein
MSTPNHTPNRVLLGNTRGNIKEIGNRKGTIAAGLAVRLTTGGLLSTASADGQLLGISVGADLSDIGRTAIAHKGLGVPIQLTSGFTPTIGAAVGIDNITGRAKAAGAGVTTVNAVYLSIPSEGGLAEDGVTFVPVALIDFPGGL